MNKVILGFLIFILTLSVIVMLNNKSQSTNKTTSFQKNPIPTSNPQLTSEIISTYTSNLEVPWGLAFLPNEKLLVTERPGRVRLIDKQGNLVGKPIFMLNDVVATGEGGLLGITLHPNYSLNNFVYLYYTYSSDGQKTENRVVRYKFTGDTFSEQKVIVDKIPGAQIHNGGRIKFGPDNNLYITTGDSANPSLAQDINSLAGKILRVTDEGKAVADNPFGNLVYSYGHRNPQGIVWDDQKTLWETEHGQSATDEVNKIEMGKNYGWPLIKGDQKGQGMITPVWQSGGQTWAPTDIVFYRTNQNNYSLFFGGLRGQALFKLNFNGDKISQSVFFQNQFGRIREVILGPDGYLYISTSNRDGRGNPNMNDDKILKVNPRLF